MLARGMFADSKEPVKFTPLASNGKRVEFWISIEEAEQIKRGEPWEAAFTDLRREAKPRLQGVACELPNCFCDARLIGQSQH